MNTFTLEMLLAFGLVCAGFGIFIALLKDAHRTNQALAHQLKQQAKHLAQSQKERIKSEKSSLKNPIKTVPSVNEEGEYDYINSQEGLPAKLDLARAYIEMEDYDQAKVLLKTIIKQGDKLLRQAAEALLEKELV